MRCAAVRRAVGVEPVPAITGLISKRLRPNSLFEALEIGAVINASVSKLAAVPNPDFDPEDREFQAKAAAELAKRSGKR